MISTNIGKWQKCNKLKLISNHSHKHEHDYSSENKVPRRNIALTKHIKINKQTEQEIWLDILLKYIHSDKAFITL